VKYTPDNGNIKVRLSSSLEGMDVRVMNASEPLSEEELSKIFEPFYRVDSARAEGTGLGLAITKKIVEKHGGTVEAGMSEEGFEIHIHLPAEQ